MPRLPLMEPGHSAFRDMPAHICRVSQDEPKLILAGEPTGDLDEQTGDPIIELLSARSRDHNNTIFLVTLDKALANKADRRFRLQQGRLTEAPALAMVTPARVRMRGWSP